MANSDDLERLSLGAKGWNELRMNNPEWIPDLSAANLDGMKLDQYDLRKANLAEASLRGSSLLSVRWELASLIETDMSDAKLPGADLIGNYLVGTKFVGAKLTRVNFTDADLTRVDFSDADLNGADLRDAEVFKAKCNRKTTFRGIRLDGCHGSPKFKRFALDQEYLEEFRESGPWRKILYWIWFIFADCGRSLWPWVLWSAALATGFAGIFYGLGEGAFSVDKLPWSFWATLYYSVVTFTTLGFGDIIPQTQEAAWWVMAEVIVGYVMLGGLISIFATKLARRS